ncbi:hypothetical protein Taro_006991 [Colocasia esculenta]|uniref:Uncharacterized protein n=1 Tax=Colocasia esculenta TaxID=4460 RepID=A0A843TXM2_COLES|nr:hypothetical protein [Colocasia esculenta]
MARGGAFLVAFLGQFCTGLRNVSLGLCQCKQDEWKKLHKEEWVAVMSPYGDRYLDVKSDARVSGSIVVSITEEFHQWRLLALAFGFTLLLLAPVVSSWVPFYYSSSMALGILLVILIILFQSTMDPILAFVALIISWRLGKRNPGHANIWQLKTRQVLGNHRHAEFLSRSPTTGSRKPPLSSRNSPYALPDTPTKALIYSAPSGNRRARQVDYYSTFHKTPTGKKFSKKEWDNFTRESTRKALAELSSTPEFADWIVENASSLQLKPKGNSDDSLDSSSSDSSEETVVESDSEPGFLTRFIPH